MAGNSLNAQAARLLFGPSLDFTGFTVRRQARPPGLATRTFPKIEVLVTVQNLADPFLPGAKVAKLPISVTLELRLEQPTWQKPRPKAVTTLTQNLQFPLAPGGGQTLLFTLPIAYAKNVKLYFQILLKHVSGDSLMVKNVVAP